MKAAAIQSYGPAAEAFALLELPKPEVDHSAKSGKKSKQVLVRNFFTTVNPADCKQRRRVL